MTTHPSYAEFAAQAADFTVVPVWREVFGDVDTPVGVFDKLGAAEGSVLLESADSEERWGRFSFVGLDPLGVLTARDGVARWTGDLPLDLPTGSSLAVALRVLLARLRAPVLPGFPLYAGAVGFVGYDALSGTPSGVVDATLVVPGSMLAFDQFRHVIRVVVNAVVGDDPAADYAAASAKVDGLVERLATARTTLRPVDVPAASDQPIATTTDVPDADFADVVRHAVQRVRSGEARQLVPSRTFTRPTEASPLEVYRMLRTYNPSPYMYLLRLPEVTIVGSSPQVLVRVEQGTATVRPTAGTRRRTGDPDEDRRLAAELVEDTKELAEHDMLVELGVSDLESVCAPGTVRRTDGPTVLRYSRVMHMTSEVVGRLAEGRDAVDALAATCPAGTVAGTPRPAAMAALRELETTSRHVYGGAIGYFDFSGNADMCIAIRTVLFGSGGVATVRSGAGVVDGSDPDEEVRETQAKARALLDAIVAAEQARA
ncbi:anthranilate synthase component I [Acidothermaceae bacterium B102]|nr:anthranilate synthase component I [Acidothermaceae bacterium B102]